MRRVGSLCWLLSLILVLAGQADAQGTCSAPSRQVNEVSCVGDQATTFCQWTGASCIFDTGTHLHFQQLPLEAATATLTTALVSGVTFWPQFEVWTQANRMATAFAVDFQDPAGLPDAVVNMIARVEVLMTEDEYFVLLDGIRFSTIAARDVIYGLLETIRSFIYVFNNGNLPASYLQFQTTMLRLVAFFETSVEVFVDDGFTILIDVGTIFLDLAHMTTDPTNALMYLEDILKQIYAIVQAQLKLFKQFVMAIPGIDQICDFINSVISFINSIIGGIINDVIIPIIHFIMSAVHAITNFVQNAINFVEGTIKAAIAFATDFIKTIIEGVQTVISDIVNIFNQTFAFFDYVLSDIDYFISEVDYLFGRRRLLEDGSNLDKFVGQRSLLSSRDLSAMRTLDSDYGGGKSSKSSQKMPSDTNPTATATFNSIDVNQAQTVAPPAPSQDAGNGDDSLLHSIHIPALSCPSISSAAIIPQEATQCVYDSDCTKTTSFCVIEKPEQCASSNWLTGDILGNINLNDQWAKPCPCTQLTTGNSFCNLASGYCQEGITPFSDPLWTCPAKGVNAFVDDNDQFDTLCYLVPVYKCSGMFFSDGQPRSDADVMTCAQNLVDTQQVTGPHLCRDYCSPSAFNIDNRLVTLTSVGCACAIGWSVGGNNPLPSLSAELLVSVQTRRKLFAAKAGFSDIISMNETRALRLPATMYGSGQMYLSEHPSRWFTFSASTAGGADICMTDKDCEAWDSLCSDIDAGGNITSCSSCPTRGINTGTGHFCRRGTCTCRKVPSRPLGLDFSQIEWRGTSNCAIIGRAYGKRKSMRALEYVALRDCAHLHILGVLVGKFLGLPTLQPRFTYDVSEALRVTANIGLGALFSVINTQKNDTELWEAYTKLRLDPGLAIPATKAAIGVATKINTAFPKVRSVGSKLAMAWLKMVVAAGTLPTANNITHAMSYMRNTTTAVVRATMENNVTATHMKRVMDDIHLFRKDTMDAVTLLPEVRRRLLSNANLIPMSCPVLTDFINALVVSGSTLQTNLAHNIPFQACRLLNPNGGADWESCPSPSWIAKPYVQPPGSPQSAPPPPPSGVTSSGDVPVSTGGPAVRFVFDTIKKATGFDLLKFVFSKAQKVINLVPSSKNATNSLSNLENKLQCQYTSTVMCATPSQHNGHNLLPNAGKIVLQDIVIYKSLSLFGFSALNNVFVPYVVVSFIPRLFKKTYGMELGCSISLTPVFPVCLVADFQEAAYALLPRHLPWPSPLVDTKHRVPVAIPIPTGSPIYSYGISTQDVYKCTSLGFGDGVLEVIYWADYLTPGWRSGVSSLTTDVFMGFNASKELNYWQGKAIHTNLYKQCALLYSFTAVPVLASVALVVIFSVAVVHLLVVFLAYAMTCLKHLYEASVYAYIDSRDS